VDSGGATVGGAEVVGSTVVDVVGGSDVVGFAVELGGGDVVVGSLVVVFDGRAARDVEVVVARLSFVVDVRSVVVVRSGRVVEGAVVSSGDAFGGAADSVALLQAASSARPATSSAELRRPPTTST
jgi:hypothetical protein